MSYRWEMLSDIYIYIYIYILLSCRARLVRFCFVSLCPMLPNKGGSFYSRELAREIPVVAAFLTYSNEREAAICLQAMQGLEDRDISPSFVQAWHLY